MLTQDHRVSDICFQLCASRIIMNWDSFWGGNSCNRSLISNAQITLSRYCFSSYPLFPAAPRERPLRSGSLRWSTPVRREIEHVRTAIAVDMLRRSTSMTERAETARYFLRVIQLSVGREIRHMIKRWKYLVSILSPK